MSEKKINSNDNILNLLPEVLGDYFLNYENGALQLFPKIKEKGGALFVDFLSKEMEFKRNSFVVSQEISKAVGCKSNFRPKILDATAGLGGDAFTLACLGCDVTLIENNAVIHALLLDGMKRAETLESQTESKSKLEISKIVKQNMHLLPQQNALEFLENEIQNAVQFDVIYLDPMFPQRQKSAKVKKSMQYFQEIVGYNQEQETQLLNLALQNSKLRVVVKRPKLAPFLAQKTPSHQIKGKTIRYDVYTKL